MFLGFSLIAALIVAALTLAIYLRRARDQINTQTDNLKAEANDRRQTAERVESQQSIVSSVMRSETFRHAGLLEAVTKLNTLATTYQRTASTTMPRTLPTRQ